MWWLVGNARQRVKAVVSAAAVGGIAGLLACSDAGPARAGELSPAETIASRFPPGWDFTEPRHSITAPPVATAPASETRTPALPSVPAPASRSASVAPAVPPSPMPSASTASRPAAGVLPRPGDANMDVATRLMFNPNPTYPSAIAQPASAGAALPEQAMSYAEPSAAAAPAGPVARATTTGTVERQAAVARPPERRTPPPARVLKESNAIFNDAQIVSIRERLALTADQQRYWPAVESALRAITRQRAHDAAQKVAARAVNAHATFIDPNSAEVQRLKSAAIPLVMTMREDQKQEVRMLAHLMGLESVASQF